MKHKITPVKALTVTVYTIYQGKIVPRTKTVRKAKMAAEWYASAKTYEWWQKNGSLNSRPSAYSACNAREIRLYRRVLPIFQQYLP
jgi:hypothetical protein